MNKDLIKREDAIKAIKQWRDNDGSLFDVGLNQAIREIKRLPSADRPQGEWKPFDLKWGRSIYACSACEEAIAVPCGWSGGKPIYDYCPMCGARMKGVDDD